MLSWNKALVWTVKSEWFVSSYHSYALPKFVHHIGFWEHIKLSFTKGHSRLLFLYFSYFNTVDRKQINVRYKSLPMTGLEPWTTGIRRNRFTIWATTTPLFGPSTISKLQSFALVDSTLFFQQRNFFIIGDWTQDSFADMNLLCQSLWPLCYSATLMQFLYCHNCRSHK